MDTSQPRSRSRASFLTAALVFAAVLVPRAAPGDLDPAFGTDGILTTDFFGSFDYANAVAVDGSGRILVAGSAGESAWGAHFTIARYNSDGTLDGTFGNGGAVFIDFGEDGSTGAARALLIDMAGRIVVVGSTFHDLHDRLVIARLNDDGSLDATFADDGTARVFPGDTGTAYAVTEDHAGRIVVVGTITYAGFPGWSNLGVARLRPDGSPDATFGGGTGAVFSRFGGQIATGYGVAVDTAGRIVAAGRAYPGPDYNSSAFVVARYRGDGALDTSFDGDGWVLNDFGGRGAIGRAVLIDRYNRILVVGSSYSHVPTTKDVALARYRPDGSLDPDFGAGGMVIADLGGVDEANAVALDAIDRIVVAGVSTRDLPACAGCLSDVESFAVARYGPDGTPDPTFGHDGSVLTDFGWFGATASGVAVDPSGPIVAAGTATPSTVYSNWALARYSSEGLEPSPSPPIDIRPGDAANVLSLSAKGKIAVAVLSTAGFNAPLEADPASITFGRTGYEQSLLSRKDGSPSCSRSDTNADGRWDLVCDVLLKLGAFHPDDRQGVLRGYTTRGTPIVATDAVQIVP
jgi:uncharacterized delta-60 repeat protein